MHLWDVQKRGSKAISLCFVINSAREVHKREAPISLIYKIEDAEMIAYYFFLGYFDVTQKEIISYHFSIFNLVNQGYRCFTLVNFASTIDYKAKRYRFAPSLLYIPQVHLEHPPCSMN